MELGLCVCDWVDGDDFYGLVSVVLGGVLVVIVVIDFMLVLYMLLLVDVLGVLLVLVIDVLCRLWMVKEEIEIDVLCKVGVVID